MKQTLNILLLLINFFSFAQVAIGTTAPSSAAVLHLQKKAYSTIVRGGFLMPVVTELEQALIPVVKADDGMQVFVSDPSTGKWCWEVWDGKLLRWRSINCKSMCTTQIYLEDFNSYALHTGRDRRTDSGDYVTGVFTPWIIDDSAADFLGQDNDYAYTNSSGYFELNNTDGPVSLTTAAINITGYAIICFSVDIEATGQLEYNPNIHSTDDSNNTNDYVNIEYSIDGGAWILVTNFGGNGTIHHTLVAPNPSDGTFPVGTVSVAGLSGGNTLRIRITSNTWAADERFYYDNITVSGGN